MCQLLLSLKKERTESLRRGLRACERVASQGEGSVAAHKLTTLVFCDEVAAERPQYGEDHGCGWEDCVDACRCENGYSYEEVAYWFRIFHFDSLRVVAEEGDGEVAA